MRLFFPGLGVWIEKKRQKEGKIKQEITLFYYNRREEK